MNLIASRAKLVRCSREGGGGGGKRNFGNFLVAAPTEVEQVPRTLPRLPRREEEGKSRCTICQTMMMTKFVRGFGRTVAWQDLAV